jgi:ATP-dependent Clp protease ATP-binding subunit ClpX
MNTQAIGYGNRAAKQIDKENMLQYVTPADLKSFGLIPELIGRFPVLSYLNPLDKEALVRILTEPKNSLVKQYKKLFEMENVELSFDKKVLEYIVEKSIEFKLGARGLRSICEAIMLDAMYDIPSKADDSDKSDKKEKQKLHITLDYAKKNLEKSGINKLKVA